MWSSPHIMYFTSNFPSNIQYRVCFLTVTTTIQRINILLPYLQTLTRKNIFLTVPSTFSEKNVFACWSSSELCFSILISFSLLLYIVPFFLLPVSVLLFTIPAQHGALAILHIPLYAHSLDIKTGIEHPPKLLF